MSLRFALKQFYLINFLRNQNYLITPIASKITNFRSFSAKPKDPNFIKGKNDSEETSSGIKIMLKDEDGKILGVKTKAEAELLAKKHSLFLLQDNVDKSKYPVFKMVSSKLFAKMDENGPETDTNSSQPVAKDSSQEKKSPTKKGREVKRLAFSAKASDNDLLTKIKQTKKWISKGSEIRIHINSPQNDKSCLEDIYQRFETELKGSVRFVQKRMSENDLKFTLFSTVDPKTQVNAQQTNSETDEQSIDFDNLDPNQLLSDEFEEILEKK